MHRPCTLYFLFRVAVMVGDIFELIGDPALPLWSAVRQSCQTKGNTMTKETELDKAVVALEMAKRALANTEYSWAKKDIDVALAHLATHDIWLQELLTTKTIEDAAVKHHKV